MHDIVLDTNILSEFLAQYFEQFRTNLNFSVKHLKTTNRLNDQIHRKICAVIRSFHTTGVYRVVASTFAFLEIARKFEEIAANRFSIEEFRGFIDQPPEWFEIVPVDEALFLPLLSIPAHVFIGTQKRYIEWADALHLATALTREKYLFATSDHRLKELPTFKENII